jgi:hypothetical protein
LHENLLFRPFFSWLFQIGLGAYGSSDEDSDADDNENGGGDDQSDWEPENVLKVNQKSFIN